MKMNVVSSFLGLAIGDALGVPVEFKSREYLRNNPVRTMIGYGSWNQPPGTFSDDSSMTFCTAEALLKGYSVSSIAHTFVKWYQRGYWGAHNQLFDIGNTTKAALDRVANGVNPEVSGEWEDYSNGNGSLMRIIPMAFYLQGERDANKRYEMIKTVSSITHMHVRSVLACYFYVSYAIELIHGQEKTIALNNVRIHFLAFMIERNIAPAEIVKFSRLCSPDFAQLPEDEIKSGGYVMDTLEASIWCILHTDNYRDAVLKAVNLGGDTDTTGCVTGALAGILYDHSTFPEEWELQLAKRAEIVKLAKDFEEIVSKE